MTTAGEHLLPDLLASFRRLHPDVGVEVDVAPSDRVWPMLAHHEVDVVVAGRPPGGSPARVRAVRDNTLTVVGAPDTGFAPATATWLLRESGSGIRTTLATLLDDLQVDPPRLVLGSHGATVAAARAGLGVTLVSREAVRRLLVEGTLVELPVPGTPLARPWHAVTHRGVATRPTRVITVAVLIRPLMAGMAPEPRSRRPGRWPGGGVRRPRRPARCCGGPPRTAPPAPPERRPGRRARRAGRVRRAPGRRRT